jgi:hypothetical protein
LIDGTWENYKETAATNIKNKNQHDAETIIIIDNIII